MSTVDFSVPACRKSSRNTVSGDNGNCVEIDFAVAASGRANPPVDLVASELGHIVARLRSASSSSLTPFCGGLAEGRVSDLAEQAMGFFRRWSARVRSQA